MFLNGLEMVSFSSNISTGVCNRNRMSIFYMHILMKKCLSGPVRSSWTPVSSLQVVSMFDFYASDLLLKINK